VQRCLRSLQVEACAAAAREQQAAPLLPFSETILTIEPRGSAIRTILAAVAASVLILASTATYAAAPSGHPGGGSSGGTETGTPNNNQSQDFNSGETIDTQCANILADGFNGTSAQRRYCRQRGY
jgi:hypothetical protein